jgi:hypothetical protein
MRWISLVTLVLSCREPRPVPTPADPMATPPPAPATLQPTRRLPGPCTQRIAWASGGHGIVRHAYDDEGRLELTEWDGDGDGKVTRRTRYRYPSADRVIVEVDTGADGTIDRTSELDYSDNAALYAEACAQPDTRCERDGHGNILTISWEDGDAIELDYTCWPPVTSP